MQKKASCAIRSFTPRSATISLPSSGGAAGASPASCPRPSRAATAIASSSSPPIAIELRVSRLSVATASAMVPRDDVAGNHHGGHARSAAGARGLARRDHRNGQARVADRADPARPDRHDDDRPRAHWAARRRRHRRRRARAPDPVRRIRARDGTGFRRRTIGGAGVRRTRPSHGPPLAAGGTLGRGDARSANVAQLWGEDILITAGQSSATAALAARYLTGLAWSMIPAWCFIALRNFMGAVNRPEPALWITIAAIPVNGLLAYVLINGAFGLPRLDLLGAGLATTLVNIAMCAAAIWICYTRRPFKKYRVLGRFWRADWELLRQLMAIGLPISGALMLEWGLFSSAALLMGWIGTTALAAHQIALQVATILFMVPFGISLAATVRVGHAVGRRDPVATRRAGFGAIALGAALMVALTVIVVAFRDAIPQLFLGDDSGGNAAVARLDR